MSNWVTLPNGVHIDLDDPNNPLTGDGSFDSYLGGGSKASEKGASKGTTMMRIAGSVSKEFVEKKAAKYGLKIETMRAGNELRISVNNGSKLNDLINDLDEDGILMEYPKGTSEGNPTMSGKFDYKVGGSTAVPYHPDIEGKIIKINKDTIEVEFTTKSGITRDDIFYKEDFDEANQKAFTNSGSYKENLKTALKDKISKNLEHGYPTRAGVKSAISSFLDDYPDATNKNIVDALNSISAILTGKGKWSEDDVDNLMNDRPFNKK